MFLSVPRRNFYLFSTHKKLQPKNEIATTFFWKIHLRVIVSEAQSFDFDCKTDSSHITYNTVCDLMHQ